MNSASLGNLFDDKYPRSSLPINYGKRISSDQANVPKKPDFSEEPTVVATFSK